MAFFAMRGYGLEAQGLHDWLASIRDGLPSENALFPVHPFLLEKVPGTTRTILELLDGLSVKVEDETPMPVDEALDGARRMPPQKLLMAMAKWLEETGYLTPTSEVGAA